MRWPSLVQKNWFVLENYKLAAKNFLADSIFVLHVVELPHAEKGYEIKHTMSCRFAKTTTGPEKKGKLPEEKPILLYRELQSEGIRLLLPCF